MKRRGCIGGWVSTKSSFSFFLPGGGAEGRPLDNHYKSVVIKEGKDTISLFLDSEIEIEVSGDFFIRDDICNLIFEGFARLSFKKNGQKIKDYYEGEFCLTGF